MEEPITLEDMKRDLKNYTSRIEVYKKTKKKVEQCIAQMSCPFKVSDLVKHPVSGRQYYIAKIVYLDYAPHYRMYGNLVDTRGHRSKSERKIVHKVELV